MIVSDHVVLGIEPFGRAVIALNHQIIFIAPNLSQSFFLLVCVIRQSSQKALVRFNL